MLVCSICKGKAEYMVDIDIGRFNHHFYYCEIHKPKSFKLREMDEKQRNDGKIIKQREFIFEKKGKEEK